MSALPKLDSPDAGRHGLRCHIAVARNSATNAHETKDRKKDPRTFTPCRATEDLGAHLLAVRPQVSLPVTCNSNAVCRDILHFPDPELAGKANGNQP